MRIKRGSLGKHYLIALWHLKVKNFQVVKCRKEDWRVSFVLVWLQIDAITCGSKVRNAAGFQACQYAACWIQDHSKSVDDFHIIYAWLLKCDKLMTAEMFKVALILDNYAAHSVNTATLKNVQFFSFCRTQHLKLKLYAGVTKYLKLYHRSQLVCQRLLAHNEWF
jgi:hypothetical protein